MGSSTENSAFGPTRNPLAPDRVPGGSSGGSAAAVAAGIVPIALGSETGGSVRQPAAFCGVVGVKPTYGRVSRFGLVAFASSLDQIGVFGATRRRRGARAARSIAGHDPTRLDERERSRSPTIASGATRRCTGVVDRPAARVLPGGARSRRARHGAIARSMRLRALGAEVRDVSLPHTDLAIPVYYIIAPAEASSNLARFDGVRYGLRIERRRLARDVRGDALAAASAPRSRAASCSARTCSRRATTTRTTARRSRCARSSRSDFTRRVRRRGVHVLFTPTTPTPAFTLGAKTRSVRDVSERHLHVHGEPRRRSGDVASDRPRRRACRSAASSSRRTSTRRGCSRPPTRSSASLGAEAHR